MTFHSTKEMFQCLTSSKKSSIRNDLPFDKKCSRRRVYTTCHCYCLSYNKLSSLCHQMLAKQLSVLHVSSYQIVIKWWQNNCLLLAVHHQLIAKHFPKSGNLFLSPGHSHVSTKPHLSLNIFFQNVWIISELRGWVCLDKVGSAFPIVPDWVTLVRQMPTAIYVPPLLCFGLS